MSALESDDKQPVVELSAAQKRYKTAESTKRFSHRSKEDRLRKLLGEDDLVIVKHFHWDEEALWSFTDFQIGKYICLYLLSLDNISRRSTIIDAFASIGGSAIPFGHCFDKVHAVEANDERKKMLDANLRLFALDNVKTYSDYFQNVVSSVRYDVAFFDPPWGLDYRKFAVGTLRITVPGPTSSIDLEDIVSMARTPGVKYCIVKLPFNYDMDYFAQRLKLDRTGEIIHVKNYERPNTCCVVFIRYLPA